MLRHVVVGFVRVVGVAAVVAAGLADAPGLQLAPPAGRLCPIGGVPAGRPGQARHPRGARAHAARTHGRLPREPALGVVREGRRDQRQGTRKTGAPVLLSLAFLEFCFTFPLCPSRRLGIPPFIPAASSILPDEI